VLFDENKHFFKPSTPMSSPLPHKPSASQTWLPLSLAPSMFVIPPSPPPSKHQKSTPAIVTSSSGNFENPSNHSILNFSQNLSHHTPSLHDPLHDTLHNSNQSSSDTTLSSHPNSPYQHYLNLPKTHEPPQRTHNMTTKSMKKIFKPKQLNTMSKYPLPQTIEPTSVSQALSQPH
jgi:hypothetical protein